MSRAIYNIFQYTISTVCEIWLFHCNDLLLLLSYCCYCYCSCVRDIALCGVAYKYWITYTLKNGAVYFSEISLLIYQTASRNTADDVKFKPHLLTYSMEKSPFDKLADSQLVKKIPAFCGIRKFITAFTIVRNLSLFWVRSIQSMTPSHVLKIHF